MILNRYADPVFQAVETDYPHKCSRVGPEFQATNLPEAGSISKDDIEEGTENHEQLWDPNRAIASGNIDFVHKTVLHNKKEAGMVAFHKGGYRICQEFSDQVAKAPVFDGTDWSAHEKVRFHRKIRRHRKDISSVARALGKTAANCLGYYYGTYKQTTDYISLKRPKKNEKTSKVKPEQEKPGKEFVICDEGGELLCCASCDQGFHLKCLKPLLNEFPAGESHCNGCALNKENEVHDISHLRRKKRRISTVGMPKSPKTNETVEDGMSDENQFVESRTQCSQTNEPHAFQVDNFGIVYHAEMNDFYL